MSNARVQAPMGILGIVQIVFIILKLTGNIGWSWWVVLIPLWIWLFCLALLFLAIVAALSAANKK